MTFKANPVFSEALPPEVREAVRVMIGQLPIVFAVRNGGEVRVPAKEMAGTGQYMLDIEYRDGDFIFRARKKS